MTRVALAYNLINPSMLAAGPIDRLAEYDSENTIAVVRSALADAGHTVLLVEADERVAEKLCTLQPDVVFNIAEGIRGESRESHLPAICEMLGLPYTGSGPLALALCLDKARAKQIMSAYGILTPRYQVFEGPYETRDVGLHFPLIVKLLHEGSSMGLIPDSVVYDEAALRRQLTRLAADYEESMIVEEFVQGREFTAAILGSPPRVLPIIEVEFERPDGIVLFEIDADVRPLYERARGNGRDGLAPLPGSRHFSVCPARIDKNLQQSIEALALKTFRAFGCRDWGRMEMRLGADGKLYVLELNPIAGIDRECWFASAARAASISYPAMINEILDCALARVAHPAGANSPLSPSYVGNSA